MYMHMYMYVRRSWARLIVLSYVCIAPLSVIEEIGNDFRLRLSFI